MKGEALGALALLNKLPGDVNETGGGLGNENDPSELSAGGGGAADEGAGFANTGGVDGGAVNRPPFAVVVLGSGVF